MAYRLDKFKYHSLYQGDEGLVLPFLEADSQSFKAGDMVKFASGEIVIAVKSSTDVILGFALEDATNVTSGNKYIKVQVIRPSDIFLVAMDADDTFVVADTGINFGTETALNKWEVDQDATGATTEAVFRVLGSAEFNSLGELSATAGGPVYVSFNPSNIVMGVDV